MGAENRIVQLPDALEEAEKLKEENQEEKIKKIKVRGARGGSVKISEISDSDALERVTAIIDNKLYELLPKCPSSQDQPTEQIESSE